MMFNILLWLLVNFCLCNGFDQKSYLGPKNPDDTAKIERPCGAVHDVNCVRKFFSEHAQCKKTYGPVPDPLVRAQNSLYYPRVNLTLTFVPQMTTGLNGRIDEFYINRDTDRLVIAIEFRGLTMGSNNTYFRYHRNAREPIVTVGSSSVIYSSIIITAVIPNIDDLQLDKGEYVAFVNDLAPTFYLSPALFESADSRVILALIPAFMNPPVDLHDIFLTDAAYYAATYIQYNICDFGLLIE